MPLLLLAFIVSSLISAAYPVGVYLLWAQWHEHHNTIRDDYASRCLYGAIALSVFIFLGKELVKLLTSKRRPGEDEPDMFEADKHEFITRPDGTKIHVEYYGQVVGPAIVFVHGWNTSIKNWYYQRKHFSKDYRLIMVDLPGMGKSSRPSGNDYSLPKIAADLNAVIEHTGAYNSVLWGYSSGGMTILALLAKYKDSLEGQVKGVILEHSLHSNVIKHKFLRKLMAVTKTVMFTPLCVLLIMLSPVFWVARWMSYLNGNSHVLMRWLAFSGTQTQKQLDFSTLLFTQSSPVVMARALLAMLRYDVCKELGSINIPTLIIAANRDRLAGLGTSRYLQENIPAAQLVQVEPGNHLSLIERHKEVNAAADQFIKTLPM
jgi:pimeloyl-ACP methyl ester carboxylesterase